MGEVTLRCERVSGEQLLPERVRELGTVPTLAANPVDHASRGRRGAGEVLQHVSVDGEGTSLEAPSTTTPASWAEPSAVALSSAGAQQAALRCARPVDHNISCGAGGLSCSPLSPWSRLLADDADTNNESCAGEGEESGLEEFLLNSLQR
mmetsp:Transcript_1135/g.2890  ORF Transcript_1135/g.2890 Transcript_1135/m.2890 type:complete len:150 (-) Transcript_1135:243-692(-)